MFYFGENIDVISLKQKYLYTVPTKMIEDQIVYLECF